VSYSHLSGVRVVALALTCTFLGFSAAGAVAAPPGPVFAWGLNTYGELGYDAGATGYSTTPAAAGGIAFATAVASGEHHSLALLPNGGVLAWGLNQYGQLGNGTSGTGVVETPVAVANIGGGRTGCITVLTRCATAVSAGASHSLALMDDGTIRAWGYNGQGTLGNGTTSTSATSTPVTVTGITTATAVAGGFNHSVALLADGSVDAWGYGPCAVGDSMANSHSTPAAVPGITTATAIAAGGCHSLALLADDTISSWGDNEFGQLGNTFVENKTYATPITVAGISTATAIAGGDSHNLALLNDGTVKAWGRNSDGQLGVGAAGGSIPTPVAIPGLSHVVSIAAGSASSYALKSDGTLWAWGYGVHGELGDGGTTGSTSPVQVAALGNGVTALAPAPAEVFNGEGGHALVIAHPVAALTPASLAFGTLAPGATGPPQTVTVRNTGAPGLRVDSVNVSGADAGDFVKSADACTGQTLSTGVACTIEIRFAPTGGGARTASVEVADNATSSPQRVDLSGSAGIDTTPPRFASASMTRIFAVDPNGRAEQLVRARRTRKGATFRYTVSEPARVVFTVQRVLAGRKARSKCRKPSRANRGKRRCTRYSLFGRFAQQAAAGANTKTWSGKIGRKKLAPGRYRATLVATDAAANHSLPRRLLFKVVRR
jgi:alpha-tubulin suppressor-like RCC1 family protein